MASKGYLKILMNYSNEELCQLSRELMMDKIPSDGLCIKVVSEFYNLEIENNDIPKILTLSSPLAYELSKRLEFNNSIKKNSNEYRLSKMEKTTIRKIIDSDEASRRL